VLGADATKLTTEKSATQAAASGAAPAANTPPSLPEESALSWALQRFVSNSHLIAGAVEDFVTSYGDKDANALQEYLAGLARSRLPAATCKEGYEATVAVIKAHEAIQKRQRIVLAREWFDIG